jgi:hypothetical protein
MTPEGTPLGYSEFIKMIKAQIAAEANPTDRTDQPQNEDPANPTSNPEKEKTGGRQAHLRGFRHEMTGQFYALSKEDQM